MLVQGSTRVTLIIGHPVAQVRSPTLLNCRIDELQLDSVMVPADIAPEQLGSFLAFLRGWQNADGCVVTVPYKRAVVDRLDNSTERARRVQAVNVIRRMQDGRLFGDNVDGLGFLKAAAAHGFSPMARRALVIGSGGAGSAIADALCDSGVSQLIVTDVDADRAAWLAKVLAKTFPGVEIGSAMPGNLGECDLVANASPAGMEGSDTLPIPEALLATLRHDALVADVVTHPALTPFLRYARRRGCHIQEGAQMAAGQTEFLGRFMGVLP